MTMIVPRAMPTELEVVGELQRHPADARDQARRQADHVDGVAEVDAVLDPDLGAHQTDHAVEHHGDAAEHAARCRVDDRAELRAQPEQDRDAGRHVVGRRGVDPGRSHDADVLGVRRRRRAAERGGERRRQAVGADGSTHVGVHVLDPSSRRRPSRGRCSRRRARSHRAAPAGSRSARTTDRGRPTRRRRGCRWAGRSSRPGRPTTSSRSGRARSRRRGATTTEVMGPKMASNSHESR